MTRIQRLMLLVLCVGAIDMGAVPTPRTSTTVIGLGTDPRDCSGQATCPTQSGPTNLCAGAAPSLSGWALRSTAAPEDIVASCCAASATFPTALFVKACAAPNSTFTTCGPASVPGGCRSCPGYPVQSSNCALSVRDTATTDGAGAAVYELLHCDAALGTPPTLTIALATVLWPPNREMHSFNLADIVSAHDACDNLISVNDSGLITGITVNEPANGDLEVTGPSSFRVRADRSGSGDGRIYEIAFTIRDSSGTPATGVHQIRVPHSR